MVGQIGPLVKAGKHKANLVLHTLGGGVGGIAMGSAVGILAIAFRSTGLIRATPVIAGLGVAFLLAALRDAEFVRFRTITATRQTPRVWACTYGDLAASAAWGIDLGLGCTTRLPLQAWLLLPAAAVATGSFAISTIAFASFGLVRSVTVVSLVADTRADSGDVITRMLETSRISKMLCVVSVAGFGAELLYSLV
jgi:hypothetical protein